MSGKADFGAALARLREGRGFPTAFSFYKARDGRRALGISFPNYVKLERGRNLPQPRRLEPLLAALGLEPGSREAKELVRAYLRSLLGSERLLEIAAGAAAPDPAPASWRLAESATRQAIGQRAAQLTLDQYRLLAREGAAYACHVVLANTAAWVRRSELARLTRRTPAAVSRALLLLRAAGLAELAEDRARSPLAGRYVVPPAATPLTAAVYAALQRHRSGWPARVLHSPYLILRAKGDAMEQYRQHLGDTVSLSAIYGDVKPGDGSAMFLVEGRVSRLFD